MSPDVLLTIPQVARALHISESFTRDLCLRGEIVAMKFGRTWRVSDVALADYINKSRWIPMTAIAARFTGRDHVAARFDRAKREVA